MKLYIIILKAKDNNSEIKAGHRLWVGFEKNYKTARKKSLELNKGYTSVFFGSLSLFEMIYLLPFFNRKRK